MSGRSKLPLIDSDGSSAGMLPTTQLLAGVAISGASILLLVLCWNDLPDSVTPGLTRLMKGIFAALAALGLAIAGFAARFLLRERAFLRALSRGSADAWKLDRRWTQGRSSDGARAAGLRSALWAAFAVAQALFLIFCLDTIYELGSLRPWGPLIISAATIFAGVVVFEMFGSTIRKALRQGDSLLRWEGATPIRLGTDWAGTAEVGVPLNAPRAWLRFVIERPVLIDEASFTRRREAQRVEAQATASPKPNGGTFIELSFKTAADAPTTAWSRYPSLYWELVLEDEKAGFATAFPLPLYP